MKSLFEYIYGEEKSDYDKFTRAKKENRIILIDDIHLISPKHISRFLEGIEEEFGYIVYTTNNLLKLDIQERIEAAIAKDSYSCFRLLPLYRKKRKQLVEKIIPLKYPTYTPKETTALVERICHILDLQRRYIPLTPEIILQFLEHYANYQMESAQNDGNIFSKVFESSLTNALSPHVTAPLTVDKTMLVLGKIAYYIHDYLTGTAETIVDFQYETHQIERLLVFSQSKRIEDFCTQSKFLMEESKSPAAKLALACIVRQILVKGSLSTQQIRRLESTFSMEKSHSATVYRRYLEKKKEN